jgi:hypothetical protein
VGVEHGHPLNRGLRRRASSIESGAITELWADTRLMKCPIWGMPLGGVGGCHHGHALALGDRIGGEGLLRQGGPDQGDHAAGGSAG